MESNYKESSSREKIYLTGGFFCIQFYILCPSIILQFHMVELTNPQKMTTTQDGHVINQMTEFFSKIKGIFCVLFFTLVLVIIISCCIFFLPGLSETPKLPPGNVNGWKITSELQYNEWGIHFFFSGNGNGILLLIVRKLLWW